MMRAGTTIQLCAILIAGTALAIAAPAQSQTAPAAPFPAAPANNDLTVVGSRMPAAEAPRSATCEALSRDPFFRALLSVSGAGGMLGPTIYLPTRLPRNPDYSAPPTVPVGSPLPTVPKIRFGASGPYITQDGSTAASGADITTDSRAGATAATTATEQSDLDRAVAACRVNYSRGSGGPAISSGADQASFSGQASGGNAAALDAMNGRFATSRAQIARNDTTLPMALALFDQGRYGESLEWFQKASSKLPFRDGGDEAALYVGKLYLMGLGDKSDPVEGVKWLKKAATAAFDPTIETPMFDPKQPERNTAVGEASVILGNIYRLGFRGIPKDMDEARKWYDRASDVGHVPAAKTLGDLCYRGVDMPRDVKKAVSYYRRAAKLDYPAAEVALADILYEGAEGVPQDRKSALSWYQAAAKHDDSRALYALAQAYDLGEGVKADPQMAIGFYKSAALQGNVAAKAAMGTYFYEGKLLPKNPAVARLWFEAAAAGADPDAMFNLAAMLAKGEGGPKDLPKAWAWLKHASARGHETAPRAIAILERQMTDAEKKAAAAMLPPA